MTGRMSAADLRALAAQPSGKGRVRGTQRTERDGMRFDSKHEDRRHAQLQMAERAGLISKLERQVKIPLMGRDGPILTPTGRQMHYVADFKYVETETGREVIEDAKGIQTDTFRMKRAILAAQGVEVRLS